MSGNENDKYVDSTPTDFELNRIATLGQQYVGLDARIAQMTVELETLKKEYNDISMVQLPEAMNSVGMAEFRLTNGFKLRVRKVIDCRLPKENADSADRWLDGHGHTGLMKHSLEVYIPKGSDAVEIDSLRNLIQRQGFDVYEAKTIHYQTLNKWARDMDEGGEMIPEEIFKVWRGHKTYIEE